MSAKQALLEEVYVTAHESGYVVFAIDNRYEKRHVEGYVENITGEKLSVIHRGKFNDLNDEWVVTF